MKQSISCFALVVRDYDEAIAFYTKTLRFDLIEDTRLSAVKRWVVVAPPGSTGSRVLLAKAASPEQESRIGNQTGGRVFLFLETDDFWRDYGEMKARCNIPPGSERGELWHGGSFRGSLRQSMGPSAISLTPMLGIGATAFGVDLFESAWKPKGVYKVSRRSRL